MGEIKKTNLDRYQNSRDNDYGEGSKGRIQSYITRLKELRASLPDELQSVDSLDNYVGNIAFSIANIEGYIIDELKAFSKYGNKNKSGELILLMGGFP